MRESVSAVPLLNDCTPRVVFLIAVPVELRCSRVQLGDELLKKEEEEEEEIRRAGSFDTTCLDETNSKEAREGIMERRQRKNWSGRNVWTVEGGRMGCARTAAPTTWTG